MSQFSVLYGQVGNLTASTATSNDKLFTNEAYHDVNAASRWSWLESKMSVTLVAGTKTYTILGTTPLVTDCDGIYDVELVLTASGAATRLVQCTPQFMSRCFAHCFTNSEPSMWAIIGGTAATTSATVVQGGQQQLVLNYPPTAVAAQGVTLNVYYWRSAASIAMSADTDVPLVPVPYERLIIMRACAIAMERNLMFQEAAGYMRAYDEALARAIQADRANRFSDFEMAEIRAVPQMDPRTPQLQPATQPYPVAS